MANHELSSARRLQRFQRKPDAAAIKTGEAAQGIARAAEWFAPDHPYSQVRARIRATHGANAYPGSPAVAAESIRPMDNMYLSELHPQEFAALQTNMAAYGGVFKQMDGWDMALSMCPPEPRRGLLLIDPNSAASSSQMNNDIWL